MSLATRVQSILQGLLRRQRMETDMEAELRFHLARYTEDLIRSGVPREEADRLARIEFGHLEPLKEDCRQARGLRFLDETAQDLRYAARMLRKNPGFTSIAVLTLALGIGANTSIFSVVNAWVLKPLPYHDPDRLVSIRTIDTKRNWSGGSSAADLYDWRRQGQVFEQICGWALPSFSLMQGDEPRQIDGARANSEFFQMLGVAPQLGRGFLPEDDRPDAPPVAILSDQLWRNRFGADPALVGKTIQVDGKATTVVGVLPAGFHLPLTGRAALWMPLALSEPNLKNRQMRYLEVIARVKPGVNLKRATSFLKTTAWRLQQTYPTTNANRSVELAPLRDEIARQGGNQQALIAFGLVVCVLLIACANVANLIVSRAVGRRKEMAVRLAIGAGRRRLYRQLLTENLLLFLMASALSVVFAFWGVNWIARSIPADVRVYLPNSGALSVDTGTLLYTLGVALAAGLLFGFAPALQCRKVDVSCGLKEIASHLSTGSGGARLKNCLIVFEMSLSLMVLVASGLLIKGLMRMNASDPGFQPAGLVIAPLLLSDPKYNEPKRTAAFYDDLVDRLRQTPGIAEAAAGMLIPYAGSDNLTRFAIDGQPPQQGQAQAFLRLDVVTLAYFPTMGIPLLAGRDFSRQDNADSARVAVINQTMARRHWPNEDPIGRRFRYGINLGATATVVGIVRDTKGQNEGDLPEPQAYLPHQQLPARSMRLIVRPGPGMSDIGAAIRRAAASVDKSQAVADFQTMEQLMVNIRTPFRIMGQVTSFFGGLSLFLAALGIYGVMAYSVAARRHEFGIRLALGAAARDLLALVLGQGLKLAAIGLALGLAGALAVTRLMTSVLYQVSPTDLSTFLGISALLLLVAAAASYLSARRASGLEPTRALRYE